MSHHHHQHSDSHSQTERWKPHKDWRVILAAVVMLIAMIIYVLSLDERLFPGDPGSRQPPASQSTQGNP